MVTAIDEPVLDVLRGAECDGNALVLTGHLDRKLYLQTDKVLKAIGGKWNRSAKAHLFDEDAAPLISDVITTGQYVDQKKHFQFYETPETLARELCERAGVDESSLVLEPSAGHGRIVRAALELGATVDAVELNDKAADRLGELSLRSLICADFLEQTSEPVYDQVVMNPPFTRSQDIQHVQHALSFLKPGGRLVSVMSPGFTYRQDWLATEFRQLVEEREALVTDLPEGTFKSEGTLVRTVIIEFES